MTSPAPLWIASCALLLIGAAPEHAQPAKQQPQNGAVSQPSLAERTHCAPFVAEPADGVRHGNGNPNEKNGSSGLSNGVAYLIEGCMVDVTPEGIRPLPPKGHEGRLIPLKPS